MCLFMKMPLSYELWKLRIELSNLVGQTASYYFHINSSLFLLPPLTIYHIKWNCGTKKVIYLTKNLVIQLIGSLVITCNHWIKKKKVVCITRFSLKPSNRLTTCKRTPLQSRNEFQHSLQWLQRIHATYIRTRQTTKAVTTFCWHHCHQILGHEYLTINWNK